MRTTTTRLSVVLLGLLPCCGFATESNPLAARQQAQDNARSLAVDLVAAVLDVQLRQLEENGLAELPLYRDIQSMRANVSQLAAREMNDIVRLLTEAKSAPPRTADQKWTEAREAIRHVVAQLMAERQKLHRRMNVSRLASQAKAIVVQQERASALSRSLATLAAGERERAALHAIESQVDIESHFQQLLSGLNDVSHWGGEVAAGALDGLKIVRVYEITDQLHQACQALRRADVQATQTAQANAMVGLAALVERLDRLQGLENADRDAALRLVRELIDRQQQVRERCKAAEAQSIAPSSLIELQTSLHAELGKLPLTLAKFPATVPLSEGAKAASLAAIAELFSGQTAQSSDKQGRVITSLAQIVRLLEQQLEGLTQGRSADEWASEVARLTRLTEILERAASSEADIAQHIEQVKELGPLPSIVQARIDELAELTIAGGALLADAVRRAAAEVGMELGDARRKHKAVEVGELARAAEALERAAGAEREMVRQIVGMEGHRFTAEQLELWAAEQANVIAVAARIAAGVEHTCAQASQQLRELAPALESAANLLGKLTADQPPINDLHSALTEQWEAAASQLVAVAATIRASQGTAARELEQIADGQLSAASRSREMVSTLLEIPRESGVESLAHLLTAQGLLRSAQANQALAEGRPQLAAALQTMHGTEALRSRQGVAESAAQELASGRTRSSLEAASAQQEVAEVAKQLAASAAGDLQTHLQSAASAAVEASRQVLASQLTSASRSRVAVEQALGSAAVVAEQEVDSLKSAPLGPSDREAQSQVTHNLAAARQAALDAATAGTEAAEQLEQARKDSFAATRQDDLVAAQVKVGQAIEVAGEAVERAIQRIVGKHTETLADQARAAEALIGDANNADAGAAAALSQAVMAATQTLSRQTDATAAHHQQARVQEKIEQATANLAAREAQLKRDRDLASLLAESADEQQQARDAIVDAAKQFEDLSKSDSTQRLMAAQALLQAQQRFVQTMTATGEGAAAVSGQEEVVNQPIREGLQIAAGLGHTDPQTREQQAGEAGATGGENPADAQGQKGTPTPNTVPPDSRFVPSQPENTAQQIAGPGTNSQASQMMAEAAQGKGEGAPGESAPGEGTPGEGQGKTESSQEGTTSATAKKGGATKGGKTAKNEAAPKGDLETAEPAAADSRAQGKGEDAAAPVPSSVQSEAWFARLPAELRTTIQGKSRAKAPRAYEQRLRRYFESVD